MITRLERLKNTVNNIWPTYNLPVRTEAGPKSTTRYIKFPVTSCQDSGSPGFAFS
jgi:hypothetical protein